MAAHKLISHWIATTCQRHLKRLAALAGPGDGGPDAQRPQGRLLRRPPTELDWGR